MKPNHRPQSLLMRVGEVSAALGLGRSKVYSMMASAELPVVRIGRCVRVPRAALDAWLEAQARKPQGSR